MNVASFYVNIMTIKITSGGRSNPLFTLSQRAENRRILVLGFPTLGSDPSEVSQDKLKGSSDN